jgi:isocitrate dehydrogenase
MTPKMRITVAKGDGIGPEIMDATLAILEAAGADLTYDFIEVGEKVYLSGNASGICSEAWDTIRRNRIFLKSPITTPQGGGYKSLNVSTRKFLGLYANVRPCFSLHPMVKTLHPVMDLVIIRENEEDLYAGIEHQQTDEVVQCLKLISRPGCEKIIRYAFEYAVQQGRRKVTCLSKDNIMKQTDGLFHKIFDEIADEYPLIQTEHWIIDIGAARLAAHPESFDVIVTTNLYGDIISDVAAEITGSVGMGGSSNIGENCAMFEAVHGSAPMIAGQGIANPSGLLQGAILMLVHLGQTKVAERIQNAWLSTIEAGIHTADIYTDGLSRQKAGTTDFAQAVIDRLGHLPLHYNPAQYAQDKPIQLKPYRRPPPKPKALVGVDLFVHWRGSNPEELAQILHAMDGDALQLKLITNRGIRVYPGGFPETFCTDHWRCRFVNKEGAEVAKAEVISLLQKAESAGLDFIKTEHLYTFGGVKTFSLGQGE